MEQSKFPFYQKLSATLISITLLLALLYIGKSILVPLFLACLFCLFLTKPCNFLEHKGMHTAMAAAISMIVTLCIVGGIILFISTQLISLKDQMPMLEQNLSNGYGSLLNWLHNKFHITDGNIDTALLNLRSKVLSIIPTLLGDTVSTVTGIIEFAVLTPIYTFLLLLYRRLIKKFIVMNFKDQHQPQLSTVLDQSQYVIRNYIAGLALEMIIVATMVYIGLLITGAPYALLIAFIVAILNLIPYLGILIGCLITLIITASTELSTFTIVGSLLVIIITHIIDSNIVFPKIVGSKVKINSMVAIVGVVIGNAIWGIPGMFLALPIIALLKVIFDEVDELKSWGLLLGEEHAQRSKMKLIPIKKKKAKITKTEKGEK